VRRSPCSPSGLPSQSTAAATADGAAGHFLAETYRHARAQHWVAEAGSTAALVRVDTHYSEV
jgi:hypothetical protein